MTTKPLSFPAPLGRASLLLLGLMLFAGAMLQAGGAARAETMDAAAQRLERQLDAALPAARDADRKKEVEAMRAFYEKRGFQPFWFDEGGPTAAAGALFDVLRRADRHGLDPAAYGMPGIETSMAGDPDTRVASEIELTRIFLLYAGDLARGSVTPNRTAPGLYVKPERPEPEALLTEAAAAGDFAAHLASIVPTERRYVQLQAALEAYRALAAAGGWPRIVEGPTLRRDMTDPRVETVRRRLLVTGELAELGDTPEAFDETLHDAVKRFQERHGLEEDGAVGPATLREMNVPVEDRIQQIIINLERRRWEANHLGDFYVFVNIADFDLKVVEREETIWTTRVVVGRPFRKTPIFSDRIRYIEFNPHWNVPRSIAVGELLPRIRKDPGYLARNRYMLLTRPTDNSSAIDPHSVDWDSITPANFPYWIRQHPGKGNALGTMIFMFPNVHNVFLHDTAAPELFSRTVRSFSFGCIRVQNPAQLAEILLRRQQGWDEARIHGAVAREEPRTASLKEPVPVHLTYLTAWANRDGSVHFRPDIYDRDPTLIKALNRPTRSR